MLIQKNNDLSLIKRKKSASRKDASGYGKNIDAGSEEGHYLKGKNIGEVNIVSEESVNKINYGFIEMLQILLSD